MIIQFCGLSGAGKTTLANRLKNALEDRGAAVAVLDGDVYRGTLCSDLGFSRKDREENIRRMAFVAAQLSAHGIIAILCAINPYDAVRKQVAAAYQGVFTVHIHCSVDVLLQRDTKGLYRKALLPPFDPDFKPHLTGISDPFEVPVHPDLFVDTAREDEQASAARLLHFVQQQWNRLQARAVAAHMAAPAHHANFCRV